MTLSGPPAVGGQPAQPVTSGGGVEPRRRLHPLSPLLHSAKLLALVIAAISIQGAAQLGLLGFLGTVVVALCLTMAYSAITWLVTGYHVVGRELRIYDGVLVRRSRAIPLERLQAVELVRPLTARLTGLAELRLEVVGGAKTEAPLAFLTVADATALRERLLALAVRAGAPAGSPATAATGQPAAAPLPGASPAPGAPPAAGQPPPAAATAPPAAGQPLPAAATAPGATLERPLHTVLNQDVLIGQILTPQVMFLPLAIAAVIGQYWFDQAGWSLVVLASMLAAVIGVVQVPVRRVFSDWNFRLAIQPPPPDKRHPGLRIRHGLTETRSQTVPLNRVQAVGLTWPLLWRGKGWLRGRLDVAGYATPEGGNNSDRLLPVGEFATARRLTAEVLPGVDLAGLSLTPPPPRARVLAPLRQPVLGAGLTEVAFATRDGRFTRHLVIVPYQRIQSVRLVRGPLQRLLGLASVHADTAGSLTGVAAHRPVAQARELAAELTVRAQAAREADQATSEPAPTDPAGHTSTDQTRPGPAPAAPTDQAGSGLTGQAATTSTHWPHRSGGAATTS